jgi:hypothetical protein
MPPNQSEIRAAVAPVLKQLAGVTQVLSAPNSMGALHAYHPDSPRFPGRPVLGRCRRFPWRPEIARRRGPPETTTIRLGHDPTICVAPGRIAEALLCAEGFTDIRYMKVPSTGGAVLRGEIDFAFETAAWVVSQLDAGEPRPLA